MFGPGSGGFLNLGTPEVIVIGIVAWALLGPKELYRLSREAGSFLGEWQTLGRQAQKTFQEAIDTEMADDGSPADKNSPSSIAARFRQEANDFASKFQNPPQTAAAPTAEKQRPAKQQVGEAPPAVFSDMETAYANGEMDEEALMKELKATLGDPEANRANFAAQVSGDRNRQVLAETPSRPPIDDPLQEAEEDLLSVQIQEAENQLASLQAEKEVLALRRKQLEAAAQRARQRAEEDMMAGREGKKA
jgi:Sec-independent protein translocase protein TatA